MPKQIAIIAPHPDDETLGCGGTLLRHVAQGDDVHWIICTAMTTQAGFTAERVARRETEILEVALGYGFKSTIKLGFPTTQLDALPLGEVVAAIKEALHRIEAEVIYLPFRGDVHTDHRVIFDATTSCVKWFRSPLVRRVLAYETLSETGFGLDPDCRGFAPNVYVDISSHLSEKLRLLEVFDGELGEFPFPRSRDAVTALAQFRGSTAGCTAAEGFMLLKEIL